MSTLLTTKDVATLIATRTLPRCLEDLAGRIRADFLRWPEFENPPAWPAIPNRA